MEPRDTGTPSNGPSRVRDPDRSGAEPPVQDIQRFIARVILTNMGGFHGHGTPSYGEFFFRDTPIVRNG